MPTFRGSSARRGALLVACLEMSIAGCSVLGRSDRPLDRTEDPRIAQEVRARIAAEPSLAGASIRVEVNGAVVLLHGGVDGIGAWQCAITTSGLVRGVRSVADYLVIGRGPRDIQCLAPRPETAVIPGR
ncbi:MAG: BON domain-containing protein [Gemmatimonadetes bacterium]|nr:BON domain-containing protein [Gemmatimonadota bacterium]